MAGFFRRRLDRGRRRKLAPASRLLIPPERFEPRRVLSADTGFATERIEWRGQDVEVIPGRWIVKVNPVTPNSAAESPTADGFPAATHGLRDALESAGRSAWQATAIGPRLFSLDAGTASREDVLRWAGSTPGVAYAEPDFVITADASTRMPDDPSFGALWGLRNTGSTGGRADSDIDAPEAWRMTTGSRSVVIGVVDTGIDVSHPDLAANIWRNPGEIPGNGRDDDGNGHVDDVNGWDFYSGDNQPQDGVGHGTHVAGTIGAVGNNATGVVGVAWQVSLMPLKIISDDKKGSTSAAIAALDYVADLRRRGVNVVATNNSWGGGDHSWALADAIQAAGQEGILFVASAGNEGRDTDATPRYPSTYESSNIIAVASTTAADTLAWNSNYGSRTVDLAAPGVGILSTLPGGRYGVLSGTSMATPQVTGTIALLAALRPGLTATKYKEAILGTIDPVSALTGKVATGGRLNAARALAYFNANGERRVGASTTVGIDTNSAGADISAASAIDSRGRTVVVGTVANGSGQFAATRFLADGKLDRSFGIGGRSLVSFSGMDAIATAVAIDSKGRIVVAGYAFSESAAADFAVARLTSKGLLDTSFSGDGIATFDLGRRKHDGALAVAITAGDAIVAAGARQHDNSDYDFGVIRLTAAGGLDTTFGSSGVASIAFDRSGDCYDIAKAVAIDRQGRVLVAGQADVDVDGSSDFAIARLTAGGALDTTFGSAGKTTIGFDLGADARSRDDEAAGIAIDSLGRIVLVGSVRRSSTDSDFGVARLTTAGVLDATFAGTGRLVVAFSSQGDVATAVTIDSKKRIVVAGHCSFDQSTGHDFAIIRVTSTGTLDTAFGSGGKLTVDLARGLTGRRSDFATGVRIDRKGRIVVTGHAQWGDSVDTDFALVRI